MAMKNTTKDDVLEIVFSTLLTVGVLAVAVTMPNAVQLFKYFGKRTPKEQWHMRRSVSSLEKRGFVRRKRVQGEEYYTLTSTGRERAMRYKLKSMTIERPPKWDGLWRIVMFDIPEDKKLARRSIGHAIQKLGCLQYQKSVFITPYSCSKEIDFAGECYGVRKHIRITTANDVEGVNCIRKHFNI